MASLIHISSGITKTAGVAAATTMHVHTGVKHRGSKTQRKHMKIVKRTECGAVRTYMPIPTSWARGNSHKTNSLTSRALIPWS